MSSPAHRLSVEEILPALRSGLESESDPIANMANISALLFEALPRLNWAGFYRLEEKTLVLGPFQGRLACTRIPLGKGVCGTAAERGETIVVPDVHEFPGHIACDAASASEIVVPVFRGGKPVAVLDLDSPVKARFGESERILLEAVAREFGRTLG